LTWHTPAIVVPAGTPVQQEYDQAFTQYLGGEAGMATATALAVPRPAVAGGWPALPAANTPEEWARRFVPGLLDIQYAGVSRSAFGGWLGAEEAPESLPGVPAGVADKVLYISLLDPSLFGGQPTPIAGSEQWQALARARASQSVGGLLVQTDPTWAQVVATGWQPADARMTELDVSGVVTIRQAASIRSHRFSLQMIVGSARWHDGYGTVAVSGWEES
jgi:hypothetical protein